ncbi:GNAT family N-acetyltransferase [Lactobacillus psittaci]|uniref:Acetyltransferase n=1 Tax=Lactobacillus psittaci DSM 15354 TaxID=1122152 RepID=A0A0R1SAF5_9LACO|nr:GNAT family N-acetyltransferase [Lactobacillus psittaci]KRL63586.1 acetyltransferase [Lactobacillus psittaci DSM 15354]
MFIKISKDLNSKLYQDCLNLRKEVFIKEQGVPPELEVESQTDEQALYFGGYLDNQLVSCARVKLEDDKTWHIQRVATKKNFRGRGLAKELFNKIDAEAKKRCITTLTLDAQDQAQGFYLKLGYKVVGQGFMDAGIPHHRMYKEI